MFLKNMLAKIDELPFVNHRNAFGLLAAMHIAGAIGLSIEESRAVFQALTPFNLLATFAVALHFEKEKNAKYFLFIAITFLVGFFVEVLGVSTGAIFGEYTYGKTLGFKWLNVPLVIGLNWVILIHCTRHFAEKFTSNILLLSIIGAALMVGLDVLIEPVAIRFDFWSWQESSIPIQNYLAWFIVSFLLHLTFKKLMPTSNNPLAIRLLYIEIAFFAVLNFV